MSDTRSTPSESSAAGETVSRPAQQRQRELARKTVAPLGSPFEAKVVGVSFVPDYPANLYALDDVWQDASAGLTCKECGGVDTYTAPVNCSTCFGNGGRKPEPLPAVLIRNPDNAYDTNAVQVHVPALGEQGFIGHITTPLAARMAPEMDTGVVWAAEVINVLIDPNYLDRPGISIKCYRVLDELTQEAQRLGLE